MKGIVALAIDPGTHKCGLAVVQGTAPPQVLFRAVVPTSELPEPLRNTIGLYPIDIILIGDATNARAIQAVMQPLVTEHISIQLVPEAFTTQRARARWCRENPPKNIWERLFPGFRTPTEPVDDYAAVILAEQYFASQVELIES